MTNRPLAGIRVLDFCWIGAGSYTTKLFSDMGADVIKIESERRLDSLRVAPPFKDGIKGVNRSGYFADRNSSKRSITVDMKHPRAIGFVRDLLKSCDVVTNNFTPGVMEKFGLGYADVAQVRPDIVYLAMSMQGSTGPERNYLGYGLTMGALTGLQYLTAMPGREPAGTGTNYPDHIPNPCHAAFAVVAALRHRRRTGEGQFIDVAQTEPTIALLGPVMMAAASGRAEPQGNRHPDCAPQGVYRCQGEDRWIAIAVTTAAAWAALVDTLDAGALRDPRFKEAQARRAAADEIDRLIADATSTWDARSLMEALQARGVAAGAVQDASDIVDRDPQLAHRQHWRRFGHPSVGDMLYNEPPFRFSGCETRLRSPAPLLGEHTDIVARECVGLSQMEIDVAREDGLFC